MTGWACACVLLGGVLAAQPSGDKPVVVPVAELDRRQDLDGRLIQTEGRPYIWAPTQIRLLLSKAKFERGSAFPNRPSRDANLRIIGRLQWRRDASVVSVTRLEFLPSDAEWFTQREAALGPKDFQGRYELGRWARTQARLYQDEVLLERGLKMLRRGLGVEATVRGGEDPRALGRLAEKGKRMLPEERAAGFPSAQGLYLRAVVGLRKAAAKSASELLGVAQKVRGWLPGADEPLSPKSAGPPDGALPRLQRLPLRGWADTPSRLRRRAAQELFNGLIAEAVTVVLSSTPPATPKALQNVSDRVGLLAPARTDLLGRLDEAIVKRQYGSVDGMTDAELKAFVARLRQRPHPPEQKIRPSVTITGEGQVAMSIRQSVVSQRILPSSAETPATPPLPQ